MTTKYRVCNNRCVSLPDGSLLRQGQDIPSGLPKPLIHEWVSSGFVFQAGQDPHPPAAVVPAVPSEGHLSKPSKRKPAAVTIRSKIKTNGKYNYAPADLEGKSLEELNLLLVDLDTDPADTEEEAICLLTSDHKD